MDTSSLVEAKMDFEMGRLSSDREEELLKHLIQTLSLLTNLHLDFGAQICLPLLFHAYGEYF